MAYVARSLIEIQSYLQNHCPHTFKSNLCLQIQCSHIFRFSVLITSDPLSLYLQIHFPHIQIDFTLIFRSILIVSSDPLSFSDPLSRYLQNHCSHIFRSIVLIFGSIFLVSSYPLSLYIRIIVHIPKVQCSHVHYILNFRYTDPIPSGTLSSYVFKSSVLAYYCGHRFNSKYSLSD